MACWALITKFSVTCSSSVKLALTFRTERQLDVERDRALSRSALRSWTTSAMTSRMSTSVSGPGCWLLNRERFLMISRARPLCVLTNAISASTSGRQVLVALEQFHGAEDRLQRVVELVGDSGHEQAHGGQALLPDDLALQRLQHLAHLALLLELAIERLARVAKTERHVGERVLHLAELEVGRQAHRAAATGRRRRSAGRRFGAASGRARTCAPATHRATARRKSMTDRIAMFRRYSRRDAREAPRCAEWPRSAATGRDR